MGVLAPRSAHIRPSARAPIDMSGNLSHPPQPLRQLLKILPFSAQKCHSVGGRGVPKFVVVD